MSYAPGGPLAPMNGQNGHNGHPTTNVIMAQPQPAATVIYQPAPSVHQLVEESLQQPIQIKQPTVNNNGMGVKYKIEKREWMSGTFDCCKDMSTCCGMMFCYPCMACSLSSRMNEFPLIPICCPGGVAALRLKMRTENHIKGSLCNDYVCSHFCTLCVLCQMKREKDSLTKLEVSKQINAVHGVV